MEYCERCAAVIDEAARDARRCQRCGKRLPGKKRESEPVATERPAPEEAEREEAPPEPRPEARPEEAPPEPRTEPEQEKAPPDPNQKLRRRLDPNPNLNPKAGQWQIPYRTKARKGGRIYSRGAL
ncbi:MAG: hypothetical protein HC884_01750 [Chloroflexaceae bacterium]|nr:hypothetical protein [Chloroflexaceae bacterium]